MRYLIDTVDGLGFGKPDSFTAWTLAGANAMADRLGDRSRVRHARSGQVIRPPKPYPVEDIPFHYEPWPCERHPDEYPDCDGYPRHNCM